MLFPKREQEKVLDFVEDIEGSFRDLESNRNQNGVKKKHPLSYLVEMAVDMGVTDLADGMTSMRTGNWRIRKIGRYSLFFGHFVCPRNSQ